MNICSNRMCVIKLIKFFKKKGMKSSISLWKTITVYLQIVNYNYNLRLQVHCSESSKHSDCKFSKLKNIYNIFKSQD